MATTELNERERSETFRLLVVAAEAVGGPQTRDAVAERARGRQAEVRLIAPALTESALDHAMGNVDDAIVAARERLERSAAELERAGISAEASVADSDLRLAIQDALQTFDANEILIVAHAGGGPFLERQGIEEAEHEFEPPITEIYVERAGDEGSEAVVADIERHPAGREVADGDEVQGRSQNLPPFSTRDLLGIIVAIVGTIVLIVLAATSGEELSSPGGFGAEDSFSSQAAIAVIAGVMALINAAHVIGLALFQAGPYRGIWRDLFAWLSLYGTPVAIVVCLLLG